MSHVLPEDTMETFIVLQDPCGAQGVPSAASAFFHDEVDISGKGLSLGERSVGIPFLVDDAEGFVHPFIIRHFGIGEIIEHFQDVVLPPGG